MPSLTYACINTLPLPNEHRLVGCFSYSARCVGVASRSFNQSANNLHSRHALHIISYNKSRYQWVHWVVHTISIDATDKANMYTVSVHHLLCTAVFFLFVLFCIHTIILFSKRFCQKCWNANVRSVIDNFKCKSITSAQRKVTLESSMRGSQMTLHNNLWLRCIHSVFFFFICAFSLLHSTRLGCSMLTLCSRLWHLMISRASRRRTGVRGETEHNTNTMNGNARHLVTTSSHTFSQLSWRVANIGRQASTANEKRKCWIFKLSTCWCSTVYWRSVANVASYTNIICRVQSYA